MHSDLKDLGVSNLDAAGMLLKNPFNVDARHRYYVSRTYVNVEPGYLVESDFADFEKAPTSLFRELLVRRR